MTPKYSIIVAMADNGVIGQSQSMPWKMPSDMKHFKMLTFGKPVIMGRKTWESIGRPLPGRDNIVLTRDEKFRAEGGYTVATIEAAKILAAGFAHERMVDDVMIIGGAEIYKMFLPCTTRIYLTEIHAKPEGDTKFPELAPSEWAETKRVHHQADEKDQYDFSFVILDRVT